MRLWFDDLHLFFYLVVLDFLRATMYAIIIISLFKKLWRHDSNV